MWKKTKQAEGMEPLPGIPWRDMSDEEFREAARFYAEANSFPPRALHGSGFFEHVEEAKPSEKKED